MEKYEYDNCNRIESFIIRELSDSDIEQMAIARKEQEIENGNGATIEYLKQYKSVMKLLFDSNRIIAAGAFKNERLVSVAFYNLLSNGEKKYTPYLCGVWTDYNERGKKLASKVNVKLGESLYKRKEEIKNIITLTFEGNQEAYNLYKKLGFKEVDGEMSFIGDLKLLDNEFKYKTKIKEKNNFEKIYYKDNTKKMSIDYSYEQYLPHPKNLSGKMTRITGIKILDNNLKYEEFKNIFHNFFLENRFSKFNVNQISKKIENNKENLNCKFVEIDKLTSFFETLEFKGIDNTDLRIKKSNSVMEKSIIIDSEKSYDNGKER